MREIGARSGFAQRLSKRGRPSVADERGFVLIVAVLLLLVITAAIGAISTASIDVNNQGTRQGTAEVADAAADSGAQVALFRLDSAGVTTAGSGTMAGGASFSYTVTTLTSASSACAGLWVQNSSSTLVQDCITSTGTVGTVSARVEVRVVGYAATATASPFTVNGVFAVNGFSTNQISGTFSLASNGSLSLSNATLTGIKGSLEYLSGKLSESQNSNQMCTGTCVLAPQASAITVPSVSASVYSAAASTNNDLTSGDITYVNASYSSSTHVLTATNNSATVTFAPGTYYFCGINVGGFSNFAMKTTGAGLVTIYIDSTYRTGTTCASGTGNIYNAGNSTGAINGSEPSNDMQLYFYGQPGCTTSCPAAITPMNAATFNADVFAPYSSMTAGGAFTMTGALVIGQFTANNNFVFTYQAPSSSGGGSGSGTIVSFYPQAHEDCVSSASSC